MACGGCARRRAAIKAFWNTKVRRIPSGGSVSGGIGQEISKKGRTQDIVQRA